MAESDSRAIARGHTARLLKMLRGQTSDTDPPLEDSGSPTPVTASNLDEPVRSETPTATAVGATAKVAEAPIPYASAKARTPNRATSRSSPSPAAIEQTQTQPHVPRTTAPIPTVGERLNREQGTLGQLMVRAERLTQLNRVLRAYLPTHLHEHVILIRMDEEEWVVHADASSWATRLRYALYNIREALGQQLGMVLPKPRIRVVPPDFPPRPQRPRPTLTPRSAKLLEVTARSVPDTRLSAALWRLAQHVDSSSEAN